MLLIGMPFSRGLPTREFFLPYAYRVVVFCLFLNLLLFVFFFRVNYYLFSLAKMCFADNFPVRILLSVFPSFFLGMCSRFDLVSFRLSCEHGWIRNS